MSKPNLWTVHAGTLGNAHTLFITKKVVALGWEEMGDLAKIAPQREAYKTAMQQTYPHTKPGAIPVNAGQLFRFVHDMQIGDIVVYPTKAERKIHFGRIEGGYIYQPLVSEEYPHTRSVNWLKMLPRTTFSQGALYELGSMTLAQIRNYADEYLAALEGKVSPVPVVVDPSVAMVADDIEETTRDFVLKTLAQQLKGHPFADFVAHLPNTMGYRTRIWPKGPDGGIDIVAHRDELGFEPPIIKVQVKSTDGTVGNPDVSALYGNVGGSEYGLLVTLGTFTPQARTFAQSKSNLRLIDGKSLVDLILDHYEAFDSRYKGLIPLKRVYVPESLNDQDE